MAFYEVIVQTRSGRPVEGVKVSLFGGGAFTSGFSEEHYTDDHGRAVLEHSASTVKVYVDGRIEREGVSPGRCLVTL